MFKLGFVPESSSLPVVHAVEDDGEEEHGRWLKANLSLRNILTVLALFGSGVVGFIHFSNRIASVETTADRNTRAVQKAHDRINLLKDHTVSVEQYRNDYEQTNQHLLQLYGAMIQRNSCPLTPVVTR